MNIINPASYSDILTFFQSLEGVYFTSVTEEAGSFGARLIKCYTGDTMALLLSLDGTTITYGSYGINLFNDNFKLDYDNNPIDLTQIVQTGNGVVLLLASTHQTAVVITKDNEDNTCIFAHRYSSNNDTVDYSSFYLTSEKYPTNSVRSAVVPSATDLVTAGAPIVPNGCQTYTPNLLLLTQSQYNLVGSIYLAGAFYWTDGQIILKDS